MKFKLHTSVIQCNDCGGPVWNLGPEHFTCATKGCGNYKKIFASPTVEAVEAKPDDLLADARAQLENL